MDRKVILSPEAKLVLTPVLLALVIGFLISLATGFALTPEKASHLPGGSLSNGLYLGAIWCIYNPKVSKLLILSTTLAGVLGFLVYCLIFVP